jgi:hypothetical protein
MDVLRHLFAVAESYNSPCLVASELAFNLLRVKPDVAVAMTAPASRWFADVPIPALDEASGCLVPMFPMVPRTCIHALTEIAARNAQDRFEATAPAKRSAAVGEGAAHARRLKRALDDARVTEQQRILQVNELMGQLYPAVKSDAAKLLEAAGGAVLKHASAAVAAQAFITRLERTATVGVLGHVTVAAAVAAIHHSCIVPAAVEITACRRSLRGPVLAHSAVSAGRRTAQLERLETAAMALHDDLESGLCGPSSPFLGGNDSGGRGGDAAHDAGRGGGSAVTVGGDALWAALQAHAFVTLPHEAAALAEALLGMGVFSTDAAPRIGGGPPRGASSGTASPSPGVSRAASVQPSRRGSPSQTFLEPPLVPSGSGFSGFGGGSVRLTADALAAIQTANDRAAFAEAKLSRATREAQLLHHAVESFFRLMSRFLDPLWDNAAARVSDDECIALIVRAVRAGRKRLGLPAAVVPPALLLNQASLPLRRRCTGRRYQRRRKLIPARHMTAAARCCRMSGRSCSPVRCTCRRKATCRRSMAWRCAGVSSVIAPNTSSTCAPWRGEWSRA